MLNNPVWVEIDVTGATSGTQYFGRFNIKPYLTLAEKSDTVRLSERLARGITRTELELQFLTMLANVRMHVVDTDANWWKNKETGSEDGFDLIDDDPIFALYDKIKEIQKSSKQPTKVKTDE
jgi:hypothetical protein